MNVLKEIELTTMNEMELLKTVKEIKGMKNIIKEYEEQTKFLENKVKKYMELKELEELRIDIFNVKYSTVTSNRFNTTLFKKEHSELYNDYITVSTSKRFLVN